MLRLLDWAFCWWALCQEPFKQLIPKNTLCYPKYDSWIDDFFFTFSQDSVFKLQDILKIKCTINQQIFIHHHFAFLTSNTEGYKGFHHYIWAEHRKLGINFRDQRWLIILSTQCLCHYGTGGGRNTMISKTESLRQAWDKRGWTEVCYNTPSYKLLQLCI